jgi:hypothetical protein
MPSARRRRPWRCPCPRSRTSRRRASRPSCLRRPLRPCCRLVHSAAGMLRTWVTRSDADGVGDSQQPSASTTGNCVARRGRIAQDGIPSAAGSVGVHCCGPRVSSDRQEILWTASGTVYIQTGLRLARATGELGCMCWCGLNTEADADRCNEVVARMAHEVARERRRHDETDRTGGGR